VQPAAQESSSSSQEAMQNTEAVRQRDARSRDTSRDRESR